MWWLIYTILLSSILRLGLENRRARLYLLDFCEPLCPFACLGESWGGAFLRLPLASSPIWRRGWRERLVWLLLLVFLSSVLKINLDN
jgi:hypothetical protein